MHSNFIRLPPDSTGKMVQVVPMWIVPVVNASVFKEEDIIVGQTSNTTMRVIQTNLTLNYIYAKFIGELQDGGSFTVGENLLVDGVVKSSTTGTQTPHYYNTTAIVSHDNPFHGQRVDAQGQSYVRYEEGAQILDSVGRTKTVLDNVAGSYKFNSLECWDNFMQTTIVGTASKTMDSNHHGLKLSTGTTTDDSISLISHKYHMHIVGSGLYAELLYQCGDSGKVNLSREWGYADNENGVFFDLMGTELNIVIRNSSTGTPIDTHVLQSNWNRDRLDGTGISGLTLDVTKLNKYWFDFHRGVRFRAGIYGPNGARIVCHDVYIANTVSALSLPTTSLPLRIFQKNIGVVVSTSESTFYEGCILTEGDLKLHTHYYEAGGAIQTVTNTVWVPLVSLRPQTDSKHTIALIHDIMASAVLSTDANIDGRIKLEIFKNPTLTGATFATTKGDSRFNVDTTATAMTGGNAVIEFFMKGTDSKDVSDHMSYLDEFLIQKIDGTQNVYTLAAKAIASDCSVIGAINWKEYFVK